MERKTDGREATSRLNDLEVKFNSVNNIEELTRSKIESLESKINGCSTVDEVRDALKDMKTDVISKIADMREDISKIDKFKAGVDVTNEALSQKADA